MGAEKTIERNIRGNLEGLGFLTYKIHVGRWGPVGFPDLLIVRNGITSYFEVKDVGEVPEPIQEYVMGKLRGAGCVAEAVQSYSEVQQILKGEKIL